MAQKNYFAIVQQDTGCLLVSDSNLPIYWMRKVAQDVADNFNGYIVRPVNIKQLKQLIIQPNPTINEH
jgi:hypothetical protein